MTHISADIQRITLNASCITISDGRTKQLDIFYHVTGFTSDFLSFIAVVELIRFFHGALQLCCTVLHVSAQHCTALCCLTALATIVLYSVTYFAMSHCYILRQASALEIARSDWDWVWQHTVIWMLWKTALNCTLLNANTKAFQLLVLIGHSLLVTNVMHWNVILFFFSNIL